MLAQCWLGDRLLAASDTFQEDRVRLKWKRIRLSGLPTFEISFPVLSDILSIGFLRSIGEKGIQEKIGDDTGAFESALLAVYFDHQLKDAYEFYFSFLNVVGQNPLGASEVLKFGLRFQTEQLDSMPPEFLARYWRIRFYLPFLAGYVYLYELGDLPQAMKWFKYSGEQKDAPLYIKELARKLERDGGVYEVGINVMGNLARAERMNHRDELAVAYEKKRHDLTVLQHLFHARKDFAEFLKTDAKIKAAVSIPRRDLERAWGKFVKREPYVSRDPFGGTVSLGPDGDVVTTTPHDRVMGLGKEGV